MELITLRIFTTLLSLLVFLAILVWAYGIRQRNGFLQDAQIPFLEDEDLTDGAATAAAHKAHAEVAHE